MMPMPGAPAPPTPAPPPAAPAGSTAPAVTQPQSGGATQRGHVIVSSLAIPVLTKALEMLGATTPEGLAVLDALKGLAKRFGSASSELGRSEMKMLGEQVPGVSQPGPGMQKAIGQRLGGMGVGGASSPPPAPMAGAA